MTRNAPKEVAKHPFLEHLGFNTRHLRTRAGLSRKALALSASVSERHLANLESGQGNVSALVLYQIADALNCSLSELIDTYPTNQPQLSSIIQLIESRDPSELQDIFNLLSTRFGETGPASPHINAIALVGLRGAGKSTLGKMLAEHLSRPFVELSRSIEEAAGCGIGEIQALYGMQAYRRHERRALENKLQQYPSAILALPGGLVTEPNTYGVLLKHCSTIWLKATPEDHMGRVVAQGDTRPMQDSLEAMLDLKAILSEREPFYSRADFTIDTSSGSLPEIFQQLIRLTQEIRQSHTARKTSNGSTSNR